MGLISKILKKFELTDEDLNFTYEKYNAIYLKTGSERARLRRDDIADEMIKRMNKKHKKEHPDAKPVPREHGRYLPNNE